MVSENMAVEVVPSTSAAATDELLNCNFADYSAKHDFRIINQHVKVCNFDAPNERFTVFTEIQMIPMRDSVTEIHLSLGQCELNSKILLIFFLDSHLPNEELGPKGVQISVQGHPAVYSRNKLHFKEISLKERKNLKHLKSYLKRAYEKFKGGITIKIPQECKKDIEDYRVISVRICSNVVKPKCVSDYFLSQHYFLGHQI